MNLSRIDLNLLVYLDVLLLERSVTRAADQLGITQPAMSNGLKRLRDLFGDPLLVRSSDGMTATDKALRLQPLIRQVLNDLEVIVRQPQQVFDAAHEQRVFRMMVSDYSESTLIPSLLRALRQHAPGVAIDLLTPSDVTSHDVERGKVDIVVNRFDNVPQSFHQRVLWRDSFCCLMSKLHPAYVDNRALLSNIDLKDYLAFKHVWVSKTGMGVGLGVNPRQISKLGWVDRALSDLGHKRTISLFTRHYQTAGVLIANSDLVATLPKKIAKLHAMNFDLFMFPPPFEIPEFELKMVWSPLLDQESAHMWFRSLIMETASNIGMKNMRGSVK